MDTETVTKALKSFIKSHRTRFETLSLHESYLLELCGLTVSAEHYKRNSYTVVPDNLIHGKFKVKPNARGYPHNFSWFSCERGDQKFEIHSNLAVSSSCGIDEGVYVVDVGVISAASIGPLEDWKKSPSVRNSNLVTFLEAKKLVVFPMLIAQFIGIVHEIKPRFLVGHRPKGFRAANHFNPSLISIGYLHGTSKKICSKLGTRGFRIGILPNFDFELSRLRKDSTIGSPLK